jgi:HEAT repeat protein
MKAPAKSVLLRLGLFVVLLLGSFLGLKYLILKYSNDIPPPYSAPVRIAPEVKALELAQVFSTNRVTVTQTPFYDRLVWKLKVGEGTPVRMDATQLIAAVELKKMGPKANAAIPVLLPLLNDPDQTTRRFTIDILEAIGPQTEVIPALVNALRHPDKDTAYYASNALISFHDTNITPRLIEILCEKTNINASKMVMFYFQASNIDARMAVPALIECLEEEKLAVEACQVLACIGPDASAAVPTLNALLKRGGGDNEYVLKSCISAALESIDGIRLPPWCGISPRSVRNSNQKPR